MTERITRLAATLAQDGVDAFFATSPITMGYLYGFHEDAHERFLTLAVSAKGDYELICPALTANQAARAGIANVKSWKDGEDPLALFQDLALRWGLKAGILAVDDDMAARMLLQMQEALPAALFKPGQPVVSQLMRAKTPEELALLRHAGKIADDAFDATLPQIKVGMTEVELQNVIEGEMRKRGGAPEFCIVAAGPASAEPHHLNENVAIKEGDVLIMDFGCRYQHYHSDITRTVALGDPGQDAKDVYAVVYAAHMAARNAIAPGVAPGAIDDAARSIITNAGYGEFFVHRTGHGIGMRVHEEPYIIAGNEEGLEPGNCFSVEPGIYLPNRFGVRIENIVACTIDGHESMNVQPAAELLIL